MCRSVSTATNTVVATIPVGTNPNSARVSPDGSRVYVTNSAGSSVTVINTQTNTVMGAAIAVQFNPRTVEFTADGARAYVANSQNVQMINTSTLAVAPTITFNSTTNGTPAAIAVSPATIVGPTMTRDKSWLRFGAVKSGAAFAFQTSAQNVRSAAQLGAGTVTWTATPTQPWIQVTPSTGTGTATLSVSVVATGSLPATGTVNAAIRLTFAGATPGVAQIPVSLLLLPNGTSAAPFGTVDTPTDNASGVTGAVPFTGWALDDIEVAQVAVCRSAFGSEVAPIDPNCGGADPDLPGLRRIHRRRTPRCPVDISESTWERARGLGFHGTDEHAPQPGERHLPSSTCGPAIERVRASSSAHA